jgi:two-component system chemotaxis response regulator CheB
VVAIGSSTGGPAALMQIFGSFAEAPRSAFLVAQHMPEGFTRGFADRLDRLTPMRASEAQGGEAPEPGTILVAPGGSHLELENRGGQVVTRIVSPDRRDKYSPSVDRLFESAAKHFGRDLMAIVLTGMGDDGRNGSAAVKATGGSVIAESEQTAVIFGMPRQAIRSGAVDHVLPLHEIATAIHPGVHTLGASKPGAPEPGPSRSGVTHSQARNLSRKGLV